MLLRIVQISLPIRKVCNLQASKRVVRKFSRFLAACDRTEPRTCAKHRDVWKYFVMSSNDTVRPSSTALESEYSPPIGFSRDNRPRRFVRTLRASNCPIEFSQCRTTTVERNVAQIFIYDLEIRDKESSQFPAFRFCYFCLTSLKLIQATSYLVISTEARASHLFIRTF